MSIYANLGRLTVKLAAIPGDGKPMDLKTPNSNLTPSYVKGREGLFVDRPGAAAAPKPVPSFSDMARDVPALRPATPRAAGAPGAPVTNTGSAQTTESSANLGSWGNMLGTMGAGWAAPKALTAAAPYLGLGAAPAAAGASVMGVPALAVPAAVAYGTWAVGDAGATAYQAATGQLDFKNDDYEQTRDGGAGSLANYGGMVGGNIWRPAHATARAVNGLADLSGIKSLWGGSGGVIGENFRARGLRQAGLKAAPQRLKDELDNLRGRLGRNEINQQQYDQQLQRINAASQRLRNSWW